MKKNGLMYHSMAVCQWNTSHNLYVGYPCKKLKHYSLANYPD